MEIGRARGANHELSSFATSAAQHAGLRGLDLPENDARFLKQ